MVKSTHNVNASVSSQSHVFRKWKGGSSTVECWGSITNVDTALIDTIPDELKKDSSKAATSVPSPFARMFLFKTSFELMEKKLGTSEYDDSIYAQLVSDTLDLLEALYLYGNKFTYKVYNWKEAMERIKKSSMRKKEIYIEAIDLAFSHPAFNTGKEIVLIYYKGKLVGGTSPFTLVFTSPNWYYDVNRSIGDSEILKIESKTQDVFFDNDFKEFTNRSQDFQEYLIKLYCINRKKFQNNFIYAGFGKYIEYYIEQNPNLRTIEDEYLPLDNHEENLEDTEINNPLTSEYDSIKIDGSKELKANGIQIFQVKEVNIKNAIKSTSDFLIRYNTKVFLANDNTKIPLVLVSGMNYEGNYIDKNTGWDSTTKINKAQLLIPIADRVLPNSIIQYPFISVDDFLEDTLIKIPYNINSLKFFTKSNEFKYLLPIKKVYYEYFSFEDLEKQLSIKTDNNSILIELKIPIKNKKGVSSVNFTKTYNQSKDYVDSKMGMGIFPFYKITNIQHKDLNDYTILLADGNKGDSYQGVRFWNYSNVNDNGDIKPSNKKSITPRSTKGEILANSLYYKIESEFDFIEIEMLSEDTNKSVKGIIIPLFEKRELNSNEKYSFAVDFGTSNTHVAYNTSEDPNPKPFEISELDMQMVLLQKPVEKKSSGSSRFIEGHGGLTFFPLIVDREFLPSLISNSTNTYYSFPIRTVTCEKGILSSTEPKLFEEINIGFNVDFDNPQSYFKYQSNLKWLLETRKDNYDKGRVVAFIEEILLLIRNKVIMNNGNIDSTQVAWMVPQSMSTIKVISDIWAKAFEKVFKSSKAKLKSKISESLAPFFYLKNEEVRYENDAVNIDIGGGTTDIMFYINDTSKYISTSLKFAAGDIWGGGIKEDKKDNGFIKNILKNNKEIIDKSGIKKSLLENFIVNPAYKSEDVISLLFKYNEDYKFTDSIDLKKPELRLIFFIHYSAIIYHLIQVIEANNLSIPRYFTFTGKGSQYLNLMCDNSTLHSLTKLLLKAYTKLEIPKFDTILIKNPKEATANGAVLFITDTSGAQISREEIGTPYVYSGSTLDENEIFNITRKTLGEALLDNSFKESVLLNMKDFIIKTLENVKIKNFLNSDFEIKNLNKYKEFLINGDERKGGGIEDSFSAGIKKLEGRKEEPVSETFFFLGLKDSLYSLSKFIAEN